MQEKSFQKKITNSVSKNNSNISSECAIIQKYNLQSRQIQNGLNISCTEKLMLSQLDEGQ